MPLTTLADEKILWENKTWAIVSWTPLQRRYGVPEKMQFAIVNKTSGRTEFPVKHPDGRIAYENPYVVAEYVKRRYALIRQRYGR